MEKETEFTLFLSSNDSKDRFPQNEPFRFTIDFLRTYTLTGKWKVCLSDISYYRKKEEGTFNALCVTCDIVKRAYIHDAYAPLLARVPTFRPQGREAVIISTPQYVDVIRSQFQYVEFTLRDEKLRYVSMDKPVFFTIHFKKV